MGGFVGGFCSYRCFCVSVGGFCEWFSNCSISPGPSWQTDAYWNVV